MAAWAEASVAPRLCGCSGLPSILIGRPSTAGDQQPHRPHRRAASPWRIAGLRRERGPAAGEPSAGSSPPPNGNLRRRPPASTRHPSTAASGDGSCRPDRPRRGTPPPETRGTRAHRPARPGSASASTSSWRCPPALDSRLWTLDCSSMTCRAIGRRVDVVFLPQPLAQRRPGLPPAASRGP